MNRREYVLCRDSVTLQAICKLLFDLNPTEDDCISHKELLKMRGTLKGWGDAIRDELGQPTEDNANVSGQ